MVCKICKRTEEEHYWNFGFCLFQKLYIFHWFKEEEKQKELTQKIKQREDKI